MANPLTFHALPQPGKHTVVVTAALANAVKMATNEGRDVLVVADQLKFIDNVAREGDPRSASIWKTLRKNRTLMAGAARIELELTSRLPHSLHESIVVAVYPKMSSILRVEDGFPHAIFAVSWTETDIQLWREARGPASLGGDPRRPPIEVPAALDAEIERLTSLSNLSPLHPNDKKRVQRAMRKFRGKGISEAAFLRAALEHGWRDHALQYLLKRAGVDLDGLPPSPFLGREADSKGPSPSL